MDRVFRRLLALLAGAIALTACQVDVTVDVVVEPDGTGLITVVVAADAEVLAAVPTLVDDLVLDDWSQPVGLSTGRTSPKTAD